MKWLEAICITLALVTILYYSSWVLLQFSEYIAIIIMMGALVLFVHTIIL